jgi:hypothetical protein
MKPPVIVRRNRLFCIDEEVLPAAANTTPLKGALYAAIHEEFKGAAYSEGYKTLTVKQRMQSINDYAWQWLKDRGFE